MDRITCSQCDSGPKEGTKGRKCEWTGHIRTPGAAACEDYFLSSASSGLACKRCTGPVEMTDIRRGGNLCCKCKEEKDDSRAGINRAVCFVVELVVAGTIAVLLVTAWFRFGWQ